MAALRVFQILSAYTENLFRGLTCHVARPSPLLMVWLSMPCSQAAAPLTQFAYVCPAGTWNVFEMGLLTVKNRADAKNHRLSLCQPVLSKPVNSEPANRLPPSFGIRFIFSPPVAESAAPPPV